jgi:hypothetical protein
MLSSGEASNYPHLRIWLEPFKSSVILSVAPNHRSYGKAVTSPARTTRRQEMWSYGEVLRASKTLHSATL